VSGNDEAGRLAPLSHLLEVTWVSVSSVINFDKSIYSHQQIFSTNFLQRGILSVTITRGDDVDEDYEKDPTDSAEELHNG